MTDDEDEEESSAVKRAIQAKNFAAHEETLSGWPVRITIYEIDGVYHCHIDNVSPGATVSRASDPSRDVALEKAKKKASERLAQTRRVGQ
jgi:hypothetical protein